MSLVNKMLRDLDARRVSDGDRAALPAAVTSLAAHQESGGGLSWLWVGAILAVAGLGVAAWYATRPSDVPVALPAATASSAPALPAAPVVTGAAEPATVIAPAALPEAKVALPTLRMADQLSASPATPVAPPPKPPAAAPKATKMPEPQVATAVPPSVQSVQSVPAVAVPKPAPAPAEARIDKQVNLPSPAERAEIEYRRGILAQRQGNPDEGVARYRAALDDYPEHAAARQTLAALLIEAKRYDDAEDLLRKGMALAPVRLASTLALARLKVERNQTPAALDLLLKNAEAGERSAEYQGFAGALLNRAGRAPEAVEHYRAATRLAPNEGRWWAGLGIALEAAGKGTDAREAYQKARTLPGLPADLAQHIEQRMR